MLATVVVFWTRRLLIPLDTRALNSHKRKGDARLPVLGRLRARTRKQACEFLYHAKCERWFQCGKRRTFKIKLFRVSRILLQAIDKQQTIVRHIEWCCGGPSGVCMNCSQSTRIPTQTVSTAIQVYECARSDAILTCSGRRRLRTNKNGQTCEFWNMFRRCEC